MKHISEIIDEILTEWSYQVNDGMPNPKNPFHIVQLRESMEELGLPKEFIFEFIQNILKEEKFKAKNKDGRVVDFDSEEARDDAIKTGTHFKIDTDDGDGDEKETKKGMDIKGNQFSTDDKKTDSDGEKQTTDMSEDELRNEDHNTTNKQLTITKTEAQEQAKKKGKKGVGAGTAESRAGEAAVHYAVRELLNGTSIDDIKKVLGGLAKDKEKILNQKWAQAALNTAQWIIDVYGDDIKEVVWDTPAGRELIGTEGHGTSSDMFIQLKDGRNVGISLKQTTNVFLLNGGYKEQHEILTESLSDILSTEELDNFKKVTSIDTYWNGNPDDSQDNGFYGELKTINNQFEYNKDFKNLVLKRIDDYKNLSDEEFEKIFDSLKYKKFIEETEKLISELPHIKRDEMKYIAKVMKDPVIRQQFPQYYDALRGTEIKLTQSILNQAISNENVAKGLKKLCMDGMHVEDILFGKSEKLDEFITLYGNKPAVELDKGALLKIFGLQDKYEQYLGIDDEEQKEEFKQQLLDEMNDKIFIDIKDGARSGEIKIKHEDGEFHLFGVKARTKPLGTSPGLEMNQTTFMGNVIKEGTPDVSEWSSSTKSRFVNARIKELLEEIEDANTEQKQALQQEIEKLKAL